MGKPKVCCINHTDPNSNLGLIFNSSVRVVSLLLFIFIFTVPQVFADVQLTSCKTSGWVANTVYVLTNDVSSTGTCMQIDADNVTLDCQGFTINYSSSSTGYGIKIAGYKYTTIMNCRIQQANNGVLSAHGIYLQSSSYNNITNVLINATGLSSSSSGAYLYSSSNNTFTNNIITASSYGAYLYSSSSNTFTNNTITANDNGAYLQSSSNYNTFTNNTITSTNGAGAYLQSSSYNTFTNNIITEYEIGVHLSYSPYNTLEGNKINKGLQGLYIEGSSLEHFQQNISSTNTINGKPIYYRSDIYGGCPTSVDTSTYSWVGIVNCANINITGTFSNSLEHLFLAYTNGSNITGLNVTDDLSGFKLYSSSNNTFTNNTITSTNNGVELWYSSNYNIFTSNNITGINYNGAFLGFSSNYNIFTSNNITSINYRGAFLTSSSNNTFTNNTITCDWYGAYLTSSSYNTFTDNTITSTNKYGAYLYSSSYNTFTDNTITSTNNYGAYLYYSSNNTFTTNKIQSSSSYAIYLSSSSNNLIYNNLLNGSVGPVSVDSNSNFWNTSRISGTNIVGGSYLGGNFYANSTGGFSQTCADSNNNGICDTNYTINDQNIDYLPLAVPSDTTPPSISLVSPANDTYSNNDYMTFLFNATDDQSTTLNCSLYINNTLNQTNSSVVNGSITNFTLTGLTDGSYNWKINCSDQSGNSNVSETRIFTINTGGGGSCGDGVCNNGENCSTCSQDCGTCPPSQYCGDGSCNNGETCSSCPQDCGSCPSPSPSCPSGMTKCGGACVDIYSDPSNCGSCGVSCQDGQICSNGACVCPSGLTLCNGECVNLLYNSNNCGSCGNKCVLGVCVNGQCQLNCPEGYYFLNNQCIPYTICETGQTPCGSTCCLSTQTCDQNTLSCYPPICQTGKTQCGYNCVDLSSDPSNCGSCGNSCPAGQICNNSKCIGISPFETCPQFAPDKCGSSCTDLSKDSSNCGACGNKCNASESCINGACTLIPFCPLGSFACGNNCCGVSQTCDPNTLTCTPPICQSGQTQCGSVCIDTSSDRFNCGGCGITCDIEEQCISGKCVSSTCGNGKCDLTENCSTCPQDCGSCQCSAPKPDLCNGRCTNILSDSNNCGTCDNACQTGYTCDNGVCKGMINANCTTDSDCLQGRCINHKCQLITCTKDSDCLSTQYCNTNLNLCVDGCSSDSACQSIAGPSYWCQLSTHECVTCPENTDYKNGECVNDSGNYQPIPRPSLSSKSSPKVFFQEQKKAALDQLFNVFGTSKTRLLAYDQCLRGSLCSTSDDCCGAPCLDSRCACSTSVCTTTADCCSGYCENGKCTSPKSSSLFFLDSISSAFSRSGCSGLIEECSPDEKTCISLCNGLTILLIASSAGLGAYLWSFFANPVIGLAAAFLSIIIGISTYPFVGIISAIFIFTFVYSRSLEKIQI